MAWDPCWEELFSQQAWAKYPGEDLIRFVARNFYRTSSRNKVRLLEVGCGPGANLWYMAREGFSVYGVDGSETAVLHARGRLDAECPGWTGAITVGDISRLPFEDGFFDAVIDNEALYCNSFEETQHMCQEMARVTRSKGKLFSRTFATGSWGDRTGERVGHNAWLVAEGPCQNKGFSRFTEHEEIGRLYRGFTVTDTVLLTRTADHRQHEIREWIVEGEKP
ncbi:class I SAM-dependent methyltransferase [Geomesophilobacter sediminis]|uniref:Class I SAM-dependent methyltransferase n=1 Tax=Geomesophilobacter sediminis TaxID=2798584 RepID=A0A8J7LTZ8_9BACT|nr:class I SAM-dependent methyltransferase [Geomesophilobacter sediminis]MBJ6723160.1 class I SAM-dependent methyltransferase [Geomesophilobacter sediminis]